VLSFQFLQECRCQLLFDLVRALGVAKLCLVLSVAVQLILELLKRDSLLLIKDMRGNVGRLVL
jgi:hypothetical protein